MALLSKTCKQAIFAIVVLLGTIGVAELALRVGGYEGNQFRSILFGDDPNSVLLFEVSPVLWWKLRSNVTTTFLGKEVVTDDLGQRVCVAQNTKRNENEVRILCLGDSSTFGWRLDYGQAYPFFLEQRLKKSLGRVQVFNGGVPGYTSFQSRLFFRKIVDQVKPDVVIIYSSNNETSLAQYSDAERSEKTSRMLWLRMRSNRLLTYQFIKGVLVRTKPFKVTGAISLEQLSEFSPRVGLSEYRDNMVQTIKLARQKGVAPLIVTVPNHVGLPYLFEVPAKNPRVNLLVTQVEERIMKREYESALADLAKAESLAPDYYKVHFLKGKLLEITNACSGIAEYEKALECHPFPERLKGSYNNILLEIAADHKVPVVDLYTTFRNHPLGPDKLFMDSCHPSALGHKIIADLIEGPILQVLTVDRTSGDLT